MFDFRRATVVLFGMLLQFSNSKHKKSKMASRRFAKNLGPMEPCSPLGMPIWPPELSLC